MHKYCFINPTPNMVRLAQSKFFHEYEISYAYVGDVFTYSFTRIYNMHKKGHFSLVEVDKIPGEMAFNPIAENSFTVFPNRLANLAPLNILKRGKSRGKVLTKDIMLDNGGYSVVSYEHIPNQRLSRQDASSALNTTNKQGVTTTPTDEIFDPSTVKVFPSLEQLQKEQGKKVIYISSGIIDDSDKSMSLQIYASSLDVERTLGEYYYIANVENNRIDFFVRNGNLHIISEHEQGLCTFSELYPIAMDYSFDLIKSHGMRINNSKTLLQNKGVYYIDDYSYFNMSLQLSDNYYVQLAKNFTSTKFLKYNNKKY